MEAAKSAYAKFVAELEGIKASKMKNFEKKFRRKNPAVNGKSDAAKGAVAAALQAYSAKLDVTISKRLADAKLKLFENFKQATAAAPDNAALDGPVFIAASQFEGSKPGYTFGTGPRGLGYYFDDSASGAVSSAKGRGQQQAQFSADQQQADSAPLSSTSGSTEEFPYDPYADFRKAEFQYHRFMKGRNRKKELQDNLSASLSAGEQRGPIGANDATEAAAATSDWDGAKAGAAVAWADLFEDPSLPLVLDIGCGQGKFVLRFALHEAEVAAAAHDAAVAAHRTSQYLDEEDPYAVMKVKKAERAALAAKEAARARRHNFLGIEMRLGLVQQATETCASLDYSVGEAGELRAHAAFLHATVNTSFLEAALAKYPGPVALLCVQLPDPRLKKNMKRRGTKKLTLERIVQPALASAVARRMNTGGLVYFSSEYLPLAQEMRRFFLHLKGTFAVANHEDVQKLRFLDATEGTSLGVRGGDLTWGEAAAADLMETVREDDALGGNSSAGGAGEQEDRQAPTFWDGSTGADDVEPNTASEQLVGGGDSARKKAHPSWAGENPFGCPTIREMFLHKSGRPVYRDVLVCINGGYGLETSPEEAESHHEVEGDDDDPDL